jgi:hypothetical protein
MPFTTRCYIGIDGRVWALLIREVSSSIRCFDINRSVAVQGGGAEVSEQGPSTCLTIRF